MVTTNTAALEDQNLATGSRESRPAVSKPAISKQATLRGPSSATTPKKPSPQDPIQLAKRLNVKVWPLSKLEKIIDTLLPSDGRGLADALRQERMFGVSTHGDADRARPVFKPFKSYYILVEDISQQYKPIIAQEFDASAADDATPPWPIIHYDRPSSNASRTWKASSHRIKRSRLMGMGFYTRPGYCENCQIKYEEYQQHVRSKQHRSWATNPYNFQVIDNASFKLWRPKLDWSPESDPYYDCNVVRRMECSEEQHPILDQPDQEPTTGTEMSAQFQDVDSCQQDDSEAITLAAPHSPNLIQEAGLLHSFSMGLVTPINTHLVASVTRDDARLEDKTTDAAQRYDVLCHEDRERENTPEIIDDQDDDRSQDTASDCSEDYHSPSSPVIVENYDSTVIAENTTDAGDNTNMQSDAQPLIESHDLTRSVNTGDNCNETQSSAADMVAIESTLGIAAQCTTPAHNSSNHASQPLFAPDAAPEKQQHNSDRDLHSGPPKYYDGGVGDLNESEPPVAAKTLSQAEIQASDCSATLTHSKNVGSLSDQSATVSTACSPKHHAACVMGPTTNNTPIAQLQTTGSLVPNTRRGNVR
eukprot:jgi/Hompol1/4271/HPOL_003585-RA